MGKGSKNLSKNNRQLATINDNEKVHYRMYKSGSKWLIAGIATFSLGIAFLGAPAVSADSTATANEPTTTVTADSTSSSTTPSTDSSSSAVTEAPATDSGSSSTATSGTTTPAASTTSTTTAKKVATTDQASVTTDANAKAAATNDETPAVATDQGSATKTVSTTTDETVPNTITSNGDTSADKTSDSATAVDPVTKGAVVKTSILGTSSTTADNSATATLGATNSDGSLTAVTDANANNDRVNNDYGDIDIDDTTNDSLAGTTIKDGQTVTGTAADIINDQGAVSTDATDPQTRAAVLYASGKNTGLSLSIAGSNESGTTFTLPTDIATNAQIGTFDVTEASEVGLTIKDEATGETFQITDPVIAQKYSVGDKITGEAVVTTTLTGDDLQNVISTITSAANDVDNTLAGAGSGIIGLVNTATDTLSGAISGVENVGSTVATLLNSLGIDTSALSTVGITNDMNGVKEALARYATGIQTAQAEITSMTDSATQLASKGLSITTLQPVVDLGDGTYEVLTTDSLSTIVSNAINTYITGWTTGIKDSLQALAGTLEDENGVNAIQGLGLVGDGITTALNAVSNIVADGITTVSNLQSQSATSLNGWVQTIVSGGVGVEIDTALPITFTDPDLSSNTPGSFTSETVAVATNIYGETTDSNTSIVYQNVDKTDLNDAIANASSDASNATALANAKAVATDPNASQKDVDTAFKALEENPVPVTKSDSSTAGYIASAVITGKTGQSAADALAANLNEAFTTTVAGLNPGLTASDFTIGKGTTNADGATVYSYELNADGQAKVAAAVKALGSGDTTYTANDLDKVASIIVIPATSTDNNGGGNTNNGGGTTNNGGGTTNNGGGTTGTTTTPSTGTTTGTTTTPSTGTTTDNSGSTGSDVTTSPAGDTGSSNGGTTSASNNGNTTSNGTVSTLSNAGTSDPTATTASASTGVVLKAAATHSTAKAATTAKAAATKLPQTDEQQTSEVAGLGILGLILSAFGLAGAEKRRKNL